MTKPKISDFEIMGQKTILDINDLHKTVSTVVEALIKVGGINTSYDGKALELALDTICSIFLDSQRKGFDTNKELLLNDWELDKGFNAEKMSDLALEHINKHSDSKMSAAWHQLIIEAILCTHPDFTLEMGDDEDTAQNYRRSPTFLDKENNLVENLRRNKAGFSLSKSGKKPQTPEEARLYKAKLQAELKLLASTLDITGINWNGLAKRMKYGSGESLRKAAGINISELKALVKKRN